jgi:hypothetical protein
LGGDQAVEVPDRVEHCVGCSHHRAL